MLDTEEAPYACKADRLKAPPIPDAKPGMRELREQVQRFASSISGARLACGGQTVVRFGSARVQAAMAATHEASHAINTQAPTRTRKISSLVQLAAGRGLSKNGHGRAETENKT